ncbi:MAG: TetR family transcriptional regulator [Nocardioides sp.]|jgi:AcrR family transcriptional regulator
MTKLLSLRDRKKKATRELLAAAAYEVVRDHGVDALSAEAVADLAGVSRRTFFNYFPTVESALVPVVTDALAAIGELLATKAYGDHPMATLADLARGDDDADLIELVTVLGLAALQSPSHAGLLQRCSREWHDDFVAKLRTQFGDDVDDLWLHAAATGLISAFEASTRVWFDRTGGELTPETLRLRRDLMADALDLLGAGFDSTSRKA